MRELLLPYRWKFAGVFFAFSGIVLAIFYLYFDLRFTMPVFAVYSSFLETKSFTTFRTNFADDLILLLLLSGLALIVFSKEKVESEKLELIRFKALSKSLLVNTILLLLSVLFVYGSGFIGILILNLFTFPILYLIFFYFLKRKGSER